MLGFPLRPEIIILDDDRDVGETLELILNKLGYQSVFFDSVERGKQYFEKELNPIVFLDIHMPGTSGLEILPYFKSLEPKTQVIMMTGERDINNVVTSLTHKASDFLLKPFSIQTVQIAIQKAYDYYVILKDKDLREEIIMRDLRLASRVQGKIFSIPDLSPYKVEADVTPVSFVSGDFNVILKKEKSILLLLGDVEDHGVTSGLIALLMTTLAREEFKNSDDPSIILKRMNQELCLNIGTHSMTAACVILFPNDKKLVYARGGHPFPVHFHKEGFSFLNEKSGQLMGILEDLDFPSYEANFEDRDVIFLFSDGIVNNLNHPLIEELNRIHKSGQDSVQRMKNALDGFVRSSIPSKEYRDDSSYILLEID
ncbi:SpoIIE family protein phosphatase [Leptospira santarosai]|uniref:SpoIIE family protein phosphatase n=1 Tax=Leptospira santarosai TaxID=28183 RepID=UPI0002BF9051|nr:response regulator [Leptospira santarosai]EMJ48230.1 stage II sporulation protein E [Leptospira santarosai str. HAI1349]EMO21342.1 stage II sporulation protein E [Leptospira santarosai str. HAI134]MDI7181596.1 SpoIIE family protein phosphatase [Leptospira santarosai]